MHNRGELNSSLVVPAEITLPFRSTALSATHYFLRSVATYGVYLSSVFVNEVLAREEGWGGREGRGEEKSVYGAVRETPRPLLVNDLEDSGRFRGENFLPIVHYLGQTPRS